MTLFIWGLPAWGVINALYFVSAEFYLLKRTGVNIWKVRWSTQSNLIAERKFGKEIKKFPIWYFGYQAIKFGTVAICIGYAAFLYFLITKR